MRLPRRAETLDNVAITPERTGAEFGGGFEGKNQHSPAFYRSYRPPASIVAPASAIPPLVIALPAADAERVAKMRQVADLVDVSVSLFLQTAHLDLLEAVNALRISAPEAAADDTGEEPSEDTAATEQA